MYIFSAKNCLLTGFCISSINCMDSPYAGCLDNGFHDARNDDHPQCLFNHTKWETQVTSRMLFHLTILMAWNDDIHRIGYCNWTWHVLIYKYPLRCDGFFIAIFVFMEGDNSQAGEAPNCHIKGLYFSNKPKSPTISWVFGCCGHIEMSNFHINRYLS